MTADSVGGGGPGIRLRWSYCLPVSHWERIAVLRGHCGTRAMEKHYATWVKARHEQAKQR